MGKPKGERQPWEGYSIESLWNGIRQTEINIKALEDTVRIEREKIANYKWMIDKLEEKKQKEIEAKAFQKAVNQSIKEQNAAHKARYPNSIHKEIEEDGD